MEKNKKNKLNLKIEKINVLDVNDASQVYGGAKDTKGGNYGCETYVTDDDKTCVTCIVQNDCALS